MRTKVEFSQLFKNWIRELPQEERDKFLLNGTKVYCQTCAKTFVWKQKFQLYQHVATSLHQSKTGPVFSTQMPNSSNPEGIEDAQLLLELSTGPSSYKSGEGISKKEGEASNTISLKWNTLPGILHTALAKMFQGDLNLTDICLVSAEGEIMEAHGIILSLCSPYFQRLLAKIPKVSVGKTVVVLGNVKITTLKHIIKFIYTGEVDIPSEEMNDFISFGQFLELKEFALLKSDQRAPRPQKKRKSSCQNSKKSDYGGQGVASPPDPAWLEDREGAFDEFQTTVSEDEQGNFSETEMKIDIIQTSTLMDEDEEYFEDEGQDLLENQSQESIVLDPKSKVCFSPVQTKDLEAMSGHHSSATATRKNERSSRAQMEFSESKSPGLNSNETDGVVKEVLGKTDTGQSGSKSEPEKDYFGAG